MSSIVAQRLWRLLPVVILGGLAVLLIPGTAHAGGPTSALLVSPGTQQTAAIYHSDPEYDQLMTLLGDGPTGTAASPAGTGQQPAVSANYVTVTWLIHDVMVWRIDRIFLPAAPAGEPLIVTQQETGDAAPAEDPVASGMFPGEAGNDSASSHRSTDPAALMDLLTKLGLLHVADGPVASDAVPVPMAVAAAADPAVRADSVWWWALGGLLIGGALTAVAVRYVPAARQRLLSSGSGSGEDSGQPQQMVKIPG